MLCLLVCLFTSYASTFDENRIGKDMLLDLDKVSEGTRPQDMHTTNTCTCTVLYTCACTVLYTCACTVDFHLCYIEHLPETLNTMLDALMCVCVCTCICQMHYEM